MQAKSVLYAAVGAPVVVARKVGHQVTSLKEKVSGGASQYSEAAGKAFKDWADEGERMVGRIGEGKVVEEFSAKVDFDQAKEQVSKLRDQLEDMLATWRTSFRPETKKDQPTAPAKPKTPAAKTPAAKTAKPSAQSAKTQAKPKTSAAKTTKSSTAARTSPTEPSSTPGDEKAS